MKKSLLFATAIFCSFTFFSCEKCADCRTTVDTNYRFESGETVEVVSGTCLYAGVEYTAGQSFKIVSDENLFEDGFRFEGDGRARIETEVCGRSHAYDNAKETYEDNGWSCSE